MSTHHTTQPNIAPAKENICVVKFDSEDDFDDSNEKDWFWSKDSYLESDHVNHPSRKPVEVKEKKSNKKSSTTKPKKRKRIVTPHPINPLRQKRKTPKLFRLKRICQRESYSKMLQSMNSSIRTPYNQPIRGRELSNKITRRRKRL